MRRFDGVATSVELVPGAADRALLEAVKNRIRASSEELYSAVFEAAPAKTPRVESEIFYAEGAEESAAGVAKDLEPVLGSLKPQPWPGGKWDHDVLVVVGSKRTAATHQD